MTPIWEERWEVKEELKVFAPGQIAVVLFSGICSLDLKELGKDGNISLEQRVWLFG